MCFGILLDLEAMVLEMWWVEYHVKDHAGERISVSRIDAFSEFGGRG